MWSLTGGMAAIKKLVFDDKKYTLQQLNEALTSDFAGHDAILADCLAAPKYGNDEDYADDIASDLIAFTEREHRKYHTLYSILSHGTLSISNNTPFGQLLGASANGRKAWKPLSDGISPTQGADYKGPTAIIKSVSKMANDNMLVNTPSTQGAVGISTSLFPSFTLGCGAVGGSATSDNVTPLNLMNVRRVAYDLNSQGCSCMTAQQHGAGSCGVSTAPAAHYPPSSALSGSCCHHGASHEAVTAPQQAGGNALDINAVTELIVAELKKVL